MDGFRFAGGSRPIRAMLTLICVISLFGMPYAVLMPLFADRVLGVGAKGMGLLMGSSGIGALCGALLLARGRGVKGLGRWVVMAAAGFGLSLILFALFHRLGLSLPLLFVTGLATVLQTAASNTLLQTLSPDHMRGRVMSLFAMMFMGMAPFGAFLAGASADRIGPSATVATGGAVCMLAAAYFARRLPALRDEARALVAANQAGGGDPPRHRRRRAPGRCRYACRIGAPALDSGKPPCATTPWPAITMAPSLPGGDPAS